MNAADEFDDLLEEDDGILAIDDLLRDAPPGCLFCRLGEFSEGEDD